MFAIQNVITAEPRPILLRHNERWTWKCP